VVNASTSTGSLSTEDRNVSEFFTNFDKVWHPGSQEDVFEHVKDLVQSAVDGLNVTVFAYGQTGAGKTFTMYGPQQHVDDSCGTNPHSPRVARTSSYTPRSGGPPARGVLNLTPRLAALRNPVRSSRSSLGNPVSRRSSAPAGQENASIPEGASTTDGLDVQIQCLNDESPLPSPVASAATSGAPSPLPSPLTSARGQRSSASSLPSPLDGLCPRAADEVFQTVHRNASRFHFEVTLSMVELYCQQFIDLLDPHSRKTLKVRTIPATGEVYLEHVVEHPVSSAEDVRRLVKRGVRDRHSRDTVMNTQSSRSHVLFIMRIASTNRASGVRQTGKLLLVDLAGSERVKRSAVTGEGLKEAIEINRSLSALGDVVAAIGRGEKHVPYRNHELTQLLQDSLGGSAKTLMFVNLSATPANREESVMSLKFASRVKGAVYNRPDGKPPRVSAPSL